jgi:hypothetical protein
VYWPAIRVSSRRLRSSSKPALSAPIANSRTIAPAAFRGSFDPAWANSVWPEIFVELGPARADLETYRKKRVPLDGCIGAIAKFCDCRVWREKNQAGEARYVFFGLRSDIEVAHYLTEVIDNAVRFELGRYKTSAAIGVFGIRTGILRTPPSRWAWSRLSRTS